jgi:hypothetical protein
VRRFSVRYIKSNHRFLDPSIPRSIVARQPKSEVDRASRNVSLFMSSASLLRHLALQGRRLQFELASENPLRDSRADRHLSHDELRAVRRGRDVWFG